MAPILEVPMHAPRVIPFGEPHTPSDRLPNGRPGPRVTQRFGDTDAYFMDRIHGAIDIGNFHCGDEILAMIPGVAMRISDPQGALGIRISHASGAVVEVWHLSGWAIGQWTTVLPGMTIGYLGASGLNIGGCHAHIMYGPNGPGNYYTRVGWDDPWPRLRQNIPIGPKQEEPEVDFSIAGHQWPKIVRVKGGSILYRQPTGNDVHWQVPAGQGFDAELLMGHSGRWLCRRVGAGSAWWAPDSALDREIIFRTAVYPE